MAETQQVIIEFITNDEQLESTIDKLEKTGAIDSKLANAFKQTTAEISKQSTEIKKVGAATTPLKKNLEDIDKATKSFTQDFMTGFNEGVTETLKEAGVTAEQFAQALKTGQTEVQEPTESLRQRLKSLTQQIAEMKLAGNDGTEAFQKLVIEAGNIKDAMADAGAEIKNAGSDTRTFDNLLGSAQAVAGGFAIAQGTAALFGDESEELQKVLLKVNAAMAILQGLQTVGNALQKEGALMQLFSTKQKQADIATTGIQTIAQQAYNIVVGESVGLLKVLRIAFAATGVGAVILGLTALTAWLTRSSKATKQLSKDIQSFNDTLNAQTDDLNKSLEQSNRIQEENIARAKARGDKQSDINEQEIEDLESTREAIKGLEDENRQRFEIAQQTIDRIRNGEQSYNEDLLESSKDFVNSYNALQGKRLDTANQIRIKLVENEKQLRTESLENTVAGIEAQLASAEEGSQRQLNLQKMLIAARAALELNADGLLENERSAILAKSHQERIELEAEFNRRRIELQLQSIEAQLVNVREGSQEELNLKKKQLSLQTQSELTSTKLSEKEKQVIKEKGFQDQLKLQREFNERVRREAIEAQISLNEAQIAQIKTNDEDRLVLQIANIELAAAAEVDAAKGNSAKIKEINAKRDADILAVKKKFIDDAAQYEIDIRTADNGPSNRVLQKVANDEKKALSLRLDAIKQLAAFQIANIDIQLKALEDEKNKKLISDKDYILKYKQLQDKKAEITEESEKATTDLIKAENIKRIQNTIQVLTMVADLAQSINETETQAENERIESQKARTAELLEAGAITEQQAKERNKRIEIEEKKARTAQAKREKDVAVFRALLAIPQAILQGLSQGGPFLAAIYGALAAAQAVIIASRPLPRFGHGKKSGYEGPAEIGETGPELYEQNGSMFLADKKQIVWLSAKDKVYNPTETKEMLLPKIDKEIMQWHPIPQNKMEIDYDKLAKAVGKHINIPGFNIDEEGFKIWEQKGNHRKNYMDKRYSSK